MSYAYIVAYISCKYQQTYFDECLLLVYIMVITISLIIYSFRTKDFNFKIAGFIAITILLSLSIILHLTVGKEKLLQTFYITCGVFIYLLSDIFLITEGHSY